MIYSSKKNSLNAVFSIVFSGIISIILFVFTFVIVFFLYNEFNFISISLLVLIPALFFIVIFLFFTRKYRRRRKIIKKKFPGEWEFILNNEVAYYSSLDDNEKKRFKQEIQIFLGEKTIRGVDANVDDKTRILVASSAVIPIFKFPEWEYDHLQEILIYPANFDNEYEFNKGNNNILGLVTAQGGTMILSKPSLFSGFKNSKDKLNVGIHEFMHNVDGEDGVIDGIPALLIHDKNLLDNWLDIIKIESENIKDGKSDINPYALTNNAEFFAVVSEYFFENPSAMNNKHPELYSILMKIFKQDTLSMFRSVVKSMFMPGKKLGRNDPCPCGSGKKYKKCCLNKLR